MSEEIDLPEGCACCAWLLCESLDAAGVATAVPASGAASVPEDFSGRG